LRDAGVAPDVIRGVVAAAGAYDVRDLSDEPDSWQEVDGHIYGETPDARGAVSPGVNIDPATPPIIVYCGSNDDPNACTRAIYFADRLRAAGVAATVVKDIGADHMGLLRALIAAGDPLNDSLLDFISRHSQGDKKS
jgi:S-formylglutathione hydrolase FrmB